MLKPDQKSALDSLMGGAAEESPAAEVDESEEEAAEAKDSQGAAQLLADIQRQLAELATKIPAA